MTTANVYDDRKISDIEHVKQYLAKGSLEQRSRLLDQVVEGVGRDHPEQLMLMVRAMAIIFNDDGSL